MEGPSINPTYPLYDPTYPYTTLAIYVYICICIEILPCIYDPIDHVCRIHALWPLLFLSRNRTLLRLDLFHGNSHILEGLISSRSCGTLKRPAIVEHLFVHYCLKMANAICYLNLLCPLSTATYQKTREHHLALASGASALPATWIVRATARQAA